MTNSDKARSELNKAKRAGVMFYAMPSDLAVDDFIDPLMLPILSEINRTGWCWTAESCQGHPDLDRENSWGQNTDPMLRLVCRQQNYGLMLSSLLEATTSYLHMSLFVYPRRVGLGQTDWRETIVSIPSKNVYERNRGLQAFSDFAQQLHLHHQESK